MSSLQRAEPEVIQKVPYDQGDGENGMDVYVSAESLKVYENPWVARPSPTAPAQHTVSFASENSGRKKHVRSDLVILGLFCLLLVIGIVCLGVEMKKTNSELRRTIEQLKADNIKLFTTFCTKQKKPKVCKENHWHDD